MSRQRKKDLQNQQQLQQQVMQNQVIVVVGISNN